MKKILLIVFILFNSSVLFANCNNKLFSFTIKNESISILNVLENISDECKISLVFDDDETTKMTQKKLNYLNIKEASLKELLELLLTQNNIFYDLSDDSKILKLSYKKTKTFFIDYVSFTKRTSTGNQTVKTGSTSSSDSNSTSNSSGSGGSTINFTTDFKFWDKIQSEISYILSKGSSSSKNDVLINQDAGMVTIHGTKKQLASVEKYIAMMMKRLHKEILVEAKVIEVEYSDEKNTGIDWSQFDLAISGSIDGQRSSASGSTGASDSQTYTSISDGVTSTLLNPNYSLGYSFSMDGLLNFLDTQGTVKVVSNPKIMTLNNQPAIINVGEEINYRYQTDSVVDSTDGSTTSVSYNTDSTFVGVTLDITPQVTDDGFIVLKINPVVSEVSEYHLDEDTGIPYLAPDVTMRQLSSIVRVKDGAKVLIGGLISKDKDLSGTSVLGLSSIPVLGQAFQSSSTVNTKTEMIIVLIPHIVKGMESPSLNNLDKTFKDEF